MGKRRMGTMVQGSVAEITNKANEALTETLNKTLEAFSLASEVNRNLLDQTVDASAAIAREGIRYLGEIQGAIRQASEEARELVTRQWALAQEFPKDAMASSQKAVALYWERGEKITRLGDAQLQALNRFTGNMQNLLGKAGKETQEILMKYTERILALYGIKN